MIRHIATALVLSTCILSTGFAQQPTAAETKSPVTEKYQQSMKKMNENMKAQPKTGDADHDFIVMMIEHHKGAIAMGEILLKEGKNEELRRMAQESAKKQREEIDKLQKILKEVMAKQDTGGVDHSQHQ